MRVVGGRYRGRTIECPPGVIRPAMDKMRESVFGSLGNLEGRSFLDLFAGSGSIGIEAASRGAAPVVLVERDRKKLPVTRRNAALVETAISIAGVPAETYLRRAGTTFDIVFLDPPFDYCHKTDLLRKTAGSGVTGPHTLVLIHHPSRETLPERIEQLQRCDRRVYGGSTVSWYGRLASRSEGHLL
ncbi:MAG: 16S rRNA (guanine(966)-N(2))-methyltransferase RsmD [Spirochaetaceae bacterium]|nr:MAG: 16S rRNA (guanine(966)-N(2))-methyltransferase RsmD [Spirochaetaceae bacterium]